MSLINQVLRDLDARGGRVPTDADRYNPWSPDAGRPGDARFFSLPEGTAPQRSLGARRMPTADSLWRRGVLGLLAGTLGLMLLATLWLPDRISQLSLASATPPDPASVMPNGSSGAPSSSSSSLPAIARVTPSSQVSPDSAVPRDAADTFSERVGGVTYRHAVAQASSSMEDTLARPGPETSSRQAAKSSSEHNLSTRNIALTSERDASPRNAAGVPSKPARNATETVASPTLLALDDVPPPAAGVPAQPPVKPSPAKPGKANPVQQVAPLAPAGEVSTAAVAPSARHTPAPATEPDPNLPTSVEKTLTPLTAAQRAQTSYAQAVESTQAGRSVQGLTQAREALRLQPGHVAARQLAAVLLHETGRTDEAVALLRAGLAQDMQSEPLGLLLARLQTHQGVPDAALATLDRHQLHSLDAEALRAGLASQLHLYKQAIVAYEAALQKQPAQAQWWMGLGVALEGDGQGTAARDAFARAQAMGLPDRELNAYVAQRLKALE